MAKDNRVFLVDGYQAKPHASRETEQRGYQPASSGSTETTKPIPPQNAPSAVQKPKEN